MGASLEDILNSPRTHRPILMGVLNVTPDSFSDGGDFFSPADAAERARRLAEQGADIIDVGAESTRPGSGRVPAAEQIARLKDVLPAATATGSLVSIDTTSADVAEFALNAGAAIINDISAGRDDPAILALAACSKAPICLMHMLGEPKTMQVEPQYEDVVGEVRDFLTERVAAAVAAGAERRRIVIDPGIGFGKRLEHNLSLLAGVGTLAALGQPVLIGASRKRFIGELTGQQRPAQRGPGTIAACLAAWGRGATIFRVHDVAPMLEALRVARAIEGA